MMNTSLSRLITQELRKICQCRHVVSKMYCQGIAHKDPDDNLLANAYHDRQSVLTNDKENAQHNLVSELQVESPYHWDRQCKN